ncbi:MAG: polysaccharide biosynthesis tyrosine autokinase [Planctomycetes bacterium]|nr:polysaccharide biosynthesis tyrosine autokinase [Planctomycetota bacterium]
MPSKDDHEFSFHEMEEVRRKLTSAEDTQHASPAFAPSGEPVPVPESQPQEFFTRNSRSDLESLQLKRTVRLFQRHLGTILLLAIILPVTMYLYDEVLNSPGISDSFRIGAVRRYASTSLLEYMPNAGSNEKSVTKYDPVVDASLNRIIAREDFRKILDEKLKATVEALEADGSNKEAAALRRYLEAGQGEREAQARALVSPLNDEVATIRTEGTERLVLKHLNNGIASALIEYFQMLRRNFLEEKLNQHWSMKKANLRKLAEANREFDTLNDKLRVEDPGAYEGKERLQKLADESFRLQLEREDMEIRIKHYKSKVNYEQLTKRLGILKNSDIAKVFVDGNELRMEWQRLEKELTRMRTRYNDVHPAIQTILNDISVIKKSLVDKGEVNANGKLFPLPDEAQVEALKTVAAMNDKLELNRMLLDELETKIKVEKDRKARWEDSVGGGKNAPDDNLVRLRDEKREEVRFLQTKALETAKNIALLEMIEQDVGKEPDFVVVRRASLASQYSPRLGVDLLVAALIGLILGCGVAMMLESMDSYLHTPSDVYYHLRLNYLGVIPHWAQKHDTVINPEHPDSHMGEVYAHLCNNVRYGRTGAPEKRLLLASALRGEGKSTIAANIAIRYALEGNSVVLVDADMRRPRGHKLVEVFEDERALECGLSNYLGGEVDDKQIKYGTSVPGLTLVPAGGRVRNAAKLLGSKRMLTLLDQLESEYDVVIVDCPAVLPVVDATILAPHMRGVLMVIAAEEAEIGAVRMALYRLQHVGAPIAGAVLNKVRESSTSYTYYGYRSKGGYYYSPYSRTYGDWEDEEDVDS